MVLVWIGLVLSGLLAGEEFVVRYGVHPALASMSERTAIEARKALVLKLRVLVPALFIPTAVISGIAQLAEPSLLRVVGLLLLLIWGLTTGIGTVPINSAVLEWDAEAPPENWRDVIIRWQRIDVLRSSAAILALVFFALAAALG